MTAEQFSLPNGPMLTTGGVETNLYFLTPFNLREMASFETLLTPTATALLDSILAPYLSAAATHKVPIIIETQTWRASRNWFDRLEIPIKDRRRIYRLAMDHARKAAEKVRDMSGGKVDAIIQGIVGPMEDAYVHGEVDMQTAQEYHAETLLALREEGVRMICAATLTGSIEAEAIAGEAGRIGLPVVLSFTLETDGRLPSGEALSDVIERIDRAVDPKPLWYEVNCVHPKHIRPVLKRGGKWVKRLRGVRCNASAKSHEELDGSDELDRGVPAEWAKEVIALRDISEHLVVLGGCCGTDGEHCTEIAKLIAQR